MAWSQRGKRRLRELSFFSVTTDALNHGDKDKSSFRRECRWEAKQLLGLSIPSQASVGGRKPRGTEGGDWSVLLREPVRSGPVITKPGAPRFGGDLEKSRFRGHSKLFVRLIGYVLQTKGPEETTSSYCRPCSQQPSKASTMCPSYRRQR